MRSHNELTKRRGGHETNCSVLPWGVIPEETSKKHTFAREFVAGFDETEHGQLAWGKDRFHGRDIRSLTQHHAVETHA